MGRAPAGGVPCPRSEPGSVSRDEDGFRPRCLHKHVIKTTAEKQPGCRAGDRAGRKKGESQKSPWPRLLLQSRFT